LGVLIEETCQEDKANDKSGDVFISEWELFVGVDLDEDGGFGESGDGDHEIPEVVVEVEGLEGDLDLLGGEDGLFEGGDIVQLEGLLEALVDDVVVAEGVAVFGLEVDGVVLGQEVFYIHHAVYIIIEILHHWIKPGKEQINIADKLILLDGVVEHVLSDPVDIEPGVFNEVEVEEAEEVAGVVQFVHCQLVALEGGQDD
jgi:hypothetical protein